MKEAVNTSILSKRWRRIWKSIASLKFDRLQLQLEGIVFVKCVNRVLDFHNALEFRVCYDLYTEAACYIDQWISFAIGKKVQRLELYLENKES